MSIKENASRVDTWIRGFFILVFGIIFYVVWWVILLVVLIQFITTVITGNLNDSLSGFSTKLTDYAKDILDYITFQSDKKPFPFESAGGSEETTSTNEQLESQPESEPEKDNPET